MFNVVVGNQARPAGKVLTEDPRISKFSFTGSTEVGKLLLAQCATTVKKVSMELGGNAPFIVFDDADIDEAVKGTIISKFRNAGQTCVCTNRIFVHRAVADEYSKKLIEAVEELKIGAGDEEGINIGPIINSKAADDIMNLVDGAIKDGATVLTGGKRDSLGESFLQPTVLSNVSADMAIAREEIFGPVAPIITLRQNNKLSKWRTIHLLV